MKNNDKKSNKKITYRTNKKSKNKRLIIDFILSINETTKFLKDTQYLSFWFGKKKAQVAAGVYTKKNKIKVNC